MKRSCLHRLAAAAAVVALGLVLRGEAQQSHAGSRVATSGRAAAGVEGVRTVRDGVKIRRLDGAGKSGIVRTPEYNTTVPGGTKAAKEWVEIKTTFDTEPEWINEVVFQYYVLAFSRKEDKAPYSFYQATVRYSDVERGRNHFSTMYIPPPAVKRYGYPVAIGVEVSVNGTVVDHKFERDPSVRVADEWWKDSAVISRDSVVARQGCLLNRKESPFALINIDDHEVVR